MSDKAREFLLKAVANYVEEDGASELGGYRDVITDIMHAAFDDMALRKRHQPHANSLAESNQNWDAFLKDQLVMAGYDAFQEERETAENKMVENISREDLPIYVNERWEFASSLQIYESRVKDGKDT